MRKITSFLLLSLAFTAGYAAAPPRVSIVCDGKPGAPVLYAIGRLEEALNAKHIVFEKAASVKEARAAQVIVAGLAPGGGEAAALLKAAGRAVPAKAEALTVWKSTRGDKQVWVIGGYDDRGLMYALLDAATRIGWSSEHASPLSLVKDITETPYTSERAVSIYTMNRAYWESRFYDEAYWARYLDMLAQNRFNTLVVIFGYENGGFLAPCYPYFFNVEGFPGVSMVGLSAQEQEKNLHAFNRLVRMAHDRGIRFTVGIWDHIYRGGVQGGGIPGTKDSPDKPMPGLVWGVNENNLIAYTKAALAKFVKEVPGLDAIQFRMHDESGLKNGEQDAFWQDIFRLMKNTVPDLRLDLRAKELKESVIQSAVNEGIHFRITTKYWMEQMGLPYHPTQINPEKSPRRHSYSDLLRYPQQYKMHWRLWNGGTARILLFGDPGFTRRFVESTHLYDGDGFEVNEPLATKMEAQPHDARPFDLLNPAYRYYDYEFERYWHFFQSFGRIGYDPKTPADTWDREFIKRFGPQAGPVLEKALHKASWILPRIVSSCYPYSAFPTTRGWVEKQRMGDLPAYAKAEGSDLMQFANAGEEAQLLTEGGGTAKILPSANSRWLQQVSDTVFALVKLAEKNAGVHSSAEFISTTTDLNILAGLARYYSRRIAAAVSYRLYERTQQSVDLDDAIAYEKKAVDAWRGIVSTAGDVYTSDIMMGVRVADLCGHWKDELAALEKGLAALESKRSGMTAGGPSKNTPRYKPAAAADNHGLFRFTDETVKSIPAGKPLVVRVKLTAAAGIQSLRLRYRALSQEEEYKALPMQATREKDVYEATIPADQINPRFDMMWLVEVIGKDNRGAIFPDVNKETPYRIVSLIR